MRFAGMSLGTVGRTTREVAMFPDGFVEAADDFPQTVTSPGLAFLAGRSTTLPPGSTTCSTTFPPGGGTRSASLDVGTPALLVAHAQVVLLAALVLEAALFPCGTTSFEVCTPALLVPHAQVALLAALVLEAALLPCGTALLPDGFPLLDELGTTLLVTQALPATSETPVVRTPPAARELAPALLVSPAEPAKPLVQASKVTPVPVGLAPEVHAVTVVTTSAGPVGTVSARVVTVGPDKMSTSTSTTPPSAYIETSSPGLSAKIASNP